MSVLWIVVFLILVCSIVWYLLGELLAAEGFQVTEPSTWDALRDFFHYQMSPVENPAGIPIAMGPGIADLVRRTDEGILTADYGSASAKSQSLAKHFFDGRNPNMSEDEKCRAIGNPRELVNNRRGRPNSQIREDSGCGWWFVEDPETPSVAAFGYGTNTTKTTETGDRAVGPAVPSALPAGGRWIWDLGGAIQAEDIKRCKRIKTCSLIAGEESVDCGYCPSKGYAIPVKNGVILYPTDPDGNCGNANSIITETSKCTDLTITARYYSGDFNYDMNGNPVKDGVYDAIKNPRGIRVRDPCALENGRLTKTCRLLMCEELAKCTKGKGLHRIIEQEGNLTETDRVAKFYLEKRAAITFSPALWLPIDAAAAPALSKADAESFMQSLYATATSGRPSQTRGAALWFLNETPFNPCDFNDGDVPMKPGETFPLECIQREFRKAGCQAAGTRYPQTEENLKAFAGMSYGAIKTQFRDLHDRMDRLDDFKNVRQQDETIRQCLGIEVQRATDTTYEDNPNVCRERGIEYWFATIPTIGSRVLYAQRLMREEPLQLVAESSAQGSAFLELLGAKGGTRGWTARTFVEVTDAPLTAVLTVPAGAAAAFYGFFVNRQKITPLTGTNGAQYRALLLQYTRNELEVRFEGNSTTALHFGAPALTFITHTGARVSPPMYLAQSAWKPVVSVRAQKDELVDENRFLDLDAPPKPVRLEGGGGRWAAPLAGASIKSLPSRGIGMEAVKTVAIMVHFEALPTGQATLWRLDQGSGGTAETRMSLQVQDDLKPVWTVQSGTSIFQVRATGLVKVGWNHIAVTVADALQASRIYINGVDATSTQDVMATGAIYPDGTAFTRLVVGGPGVSGGLAWFHIYGATLSASQVGRDLNYDNAQYSQIEANVLVRQPVRPPTAARN